MNKTGPIVVIDDDEDDQELFQHVFKRLNYGNELIFFSDPELALEFLQNTPQKPFIILSDINMPRMNGFELRDKIRENHMLAIQCTPYLFFTSAGTPQLVREAYQRSVQGFFVKPPSFKELENTIRSIVEYWQHALAFDSSD